MQDRLSPGVKAYDTQEKSWWHLNFFKHDAYLTARLPQAKQRFMRLLSCKPLG